MIVAQSHVRARAVHKRACRDPLATTTAQFKKPIGKTINEWHCPLVLVLLTIFQIRFPETGWSRENAPTRPETVPTCPALPTYYTQQTRQKVCYLSYLALYLKMAKQAHQHTRSTILSHTTRAQGPTLERTSRDASDTRVQHATCIL